MPSVLHSPLLSYLFLGLGLGACLHLFVTLNRDIRAGRRKQRALEAAIGLLSVELAEVRASLLESESRVAVLVPPTPTRCGVNLSTRGQALRMFRRGETIQQIAAALEVPEQEVELLIKVQRIALDAPAQDPPPKAAAAGEAGQ